MTSRIVRTPLGRLRLAEIEDAQFIMSLVNESVSKNFRVFEVSDVIYLIENCILSICQLDTNDTIVGFLSLKDYPLVPAVSPAAWEDFVWTKFKAIELNARNSLFIHMLCWNPIYARDVVDSLLKSVFMHDPYLQYIGVMKSLVKHQLLVPGQSRSESSFKHCQALERGVPGDQLPSLWIAERKEVCPRLRIRRAVEEDNDDIVPIIERHSPRLKELYGEFYISELISRHPESERVLLVCEHKELAVGVMCLNTQINYEALEESFELSPFAGLRHLDRPPQPREHDSATSLYATGTVNNFQDLHVSESNPDIPSTKDQKSRVTWIFEEDAFKYINKDIDTRPKCPLTTSSQLDILNLLEDDEDEFEYDIVNIDTDLLRLPRLFTNEGLMYRRKFSDDSKLYRVESAYDNKYIDQEKPKKLSTVNSIFTPTKPPEPTRYSGKPNAFLLELFAMHPDYDERYGFDMLEVAYELFPDRAYCVMCLPSSHTCFPLLEHFTLVTPFSFRMRFMNQTLYVAHINSVRGDVRVRPAEAYDYPSLNRILEHAPRKQDLLELFENSLTSGSLSSHVLLSQNQPIGLAVLGPLEDATSVRTQYDLDPEATRCGTDASILACVMSPIMEPHGRWYLRDLLRQTQYSSLFWVCRLFAKGDASPWRNLMSLASFMIPVRPRRFLPNIGGIKDLDKVVKYIATPFALWSIKRSLTSMSKVYVNNSIVIVGASRTGLAFLETLLIGPTSPYLTFTHITLVSHHGLPTVADSAHAAEICVPKEGRYTDRYLKSVPFYYYVDVMSAIMIEIDRKKKCIHFKGGGVKFYDELVLTCGQQFQHPEYLKDSITLAQEVEQGKPCNRILMDNPKYEPDHVPPLPDIPNNVMLINSLFEANTCLRNLKRLISETKNTSQSLSTENQVVVYGDCIEAYSCISALIEFGISPKMITFVEPFPPLDRTSLRVNCFNDETVDERVQASIEHLGIRTYRQCHYDGWSQRGPRVEFLRLMSPLHAIHLPCFALFYYGIKAIDLNAFKAINESGLVYDGGLVVGPKFDTNDPCVWAAGPCVRYSRRLYAPRELHKYYCSEDVGEELARQFLKKLNPFEVAKLHMESMSSETIHAPSSSLFRFQSSHASICSRTSFCSAKTKWQPVMKFDSPIVVSATLPGDLHYMKLRKPGEDVPRAVQLTLPSQGHTLTTDKRNNYFRLQMNSLHCIESITCLSKKQFSCETLAQLYGRHEAFFNNLLTRFKMNLIDDLYAYFSKTWTAALYQEPFVNLLQDIYDHGGDTVYDVVKTKYNELNDKDFTEPIRDNTYEDLIMAMDCKDCGHNKTLRQETRIFWNSIGGEDIVNTHLARYLHKNMITNPHYAMPDPEYLK
ncbi:unnamed protein product [Danaus chrysippus]|uniref:(African queen) hypothetical protein n=1 Tax=Danaus chrysippus TaxID=151541 RepID=A0A8J2R618_9NEOP|nr:unnamed protein product [Danaus chrysippus]